MLVVLQCLQCQYHSTLRLSYEEKFEGVYTCSQFKDNIPPSVEDGEEDCPKFKKKMM